MCMAYMEWTIMWNGVHVHGLHVCGVEYMCMDYMYVEWSTCAWTMWSRIHVVFHFELSFGLKTRILLASFVTLTTVRITNSQNFVRPKNYLIVTISL